MGIKYKKSKKKGETITFTGSDANAFFKQAVKESASFKPKDCAQAYLDGWYDMRHGHFGSEAQYKDSPDELALYDDGRNNIARCDEAELNEYCASIFGEHWKPTND